MRGFSRWAALACLLLVAGTARSQSKNPEPKPNAGTVQKPGEANPFPVDAGSVPVMGSGNVAGSEESVPAGSDRMPVALPRIDLDPARSPDDPEPAEDENDTSTFSSSLKGSENLSLPSDTDELDAHGKKTPPKKTQQEVAAADEQVGKYYLDRKNWRAALSRFESAMVLDPENPEVYWGLAEAERHLGEFGRAKAHYEKLLDYDPEGPHAKEVTKALKDPQVAGAKAEK